MEKQNRPILGIQRSRRAADRFLRSAGVQTDSDVQKSAPLENPDDFTDTAVEESIRKSVKGRRAQRRAVDGFWRSAMRKSAPAKTEEESGYDLHDRFSRMSDEEFDKAVADGTITKDQIRKAGQEAYENYMLDVWSEGDQADEMGGKWPSYEEFMENPEKYGYTSEIAKENDASEYPDRYYRYKPSRYTSEGGGGR